MIELRTYYPIKLLCRVLNVSRGGYHAFITRNPSKRAKENARLEIAIKVAHARTRKSYGPLRLQDDLRDDGFSASVGRIERLRKRVGIRCQQMPKFKVTTNSNHGLPVADSLLKQNFNTTAPNEVVGDTEPSLNRTCSETSQCRYLLLAGLCEPHYKPYSTATTDAAASNEKVAAYEGIRHAFYSQGTQYACPPVIYPDPPLLACVNSRCG